MDQQHRQYLDREAEAVEKRNVQLWSMNLLVMVVLAAGFLSMIAPNFWDMSFLRVEGRFIPQLFFGFIALIVLFNVYCIDQQRSLRATQLELQRQIERARVMEEDALIDPLTGAYNRRYMDMALTQLVASTDRHETSLSLLLVDLNDFKQVNTVSGHLAGDRFLAEVAKLMKRTLRRSDVIVRFGGDEFLAILPETTEKQAKRAMERLLEAVAAWNLENERSPHRMSLSCGIGSYVKGGDIGETLKCADSNMYEDKKQATQAD